MFAGITTNNALPPHYHCPKCHHHEWTGNLKKDYTINDEIITKTLKIGLDFDDKNCPSCGELMWSDGFSGDFRSFVGAELDKIPDIDLNFAGEVQSEIQDLLIEWMDGKAFGSATMKYIKADYFKQNILSKFPDIERRVQEGKDDEGNTFDFDFLAKNCSGGLDSISKHAGGVLALGNTIDHNYISPAVYPGDKPEKQLSLLHQFHDIESNLNKFDILG